MKEDRWNSGWRRIARIAGQLYIALSFAEWLAMGCATGLLPVYTRSGHSEIAYADSPGQFVFYAIVMLTFVILLVRDAWRAWLR